MTGHRLQLQKRKHERVKEKKASSMQIPNSSLDHSSFVSSESDMGIRVHEPKMWPLRHT
jgi:hypothetical protein